MDAPATAAIRDAERVELLADLRSVVREICAEAGGLASAREVAESGAARDDKAWRRLSDQVGANAMGVPEEYGGSGGGLAEILVVAEEIGAALLPVPFLSSTVLAGQVLTRCAPAAGAALEALAAGDPAVVAWFAPEVVLDDGRLRGSVRGVLDVQGATRALLPVGGRIVLVEIGADVAVLRGRSLDLSRHRGDLIFDGAAAVVVSGDAAGVLRPALDVARLALAAEQLGGAVACLDIPVAYARERHQRARPVDFRVNKQALADRLVEVELARSALDRAMTIDLRDEQAVAGAAGLALSWSTPAYRRASSTVVHVHGGIGLISGHDAHLYYRRARADAALFGSVIDHRERLAGLPPCSTDSPRHDGPHASGG
jgi:alkylation response protein AidB-like acyl-CoA dehydrogenase